MTSNFVDKIFVISRLITKFMKILCHENLELYGIPHNSLIMSFHASLNFHAQFYFRLCRTRVLKRSMAVCEIHSRAGVSQCKYT